MTCSDILHALTMIRFFGKKRKMVMIYLPQNLPDNLLVVSNRQVDLKCYPCFGLRFPWIAEDDTFVGAQVQVCGTNLEPP